jgi:uncharacterized damage-inducible protein DinB
MKAISASDFPVAGHADSGETILAFTERLLAELETFLTGLSDHDFWESLPRTGESAIGPHVRHSLEHFICLMRAIPERIVDYDRRERPVEWEHERMRAIAALGEVRYELRRHFQPGFCEEPIRVRGRLGGESDPFEVGSTLGRELHYAAFHCLHHMAVIGFLARQRGLPVAADFAKAPATLLHQSCAR